MKRNLVLNTLVGSVFSLAPLLPIQTAFAQSIDYKAFASAMEKFLSSPTGQEKIANALQTHFQKKQAEQVESQRKTQEQELEDQFKNPVKLDLTGSPSKGNPNAKVVVVEFTDFQCPFCKRGSDTMAELLKAYPNDVRLVLKNMPLEMHPQARPAARAALAAGKQGKYWEMYDVLFDRQRDLADTLYPELAKSLGLNVAQFESDMKSEEIEKQITADMELGRKNGIQGTPGFFVNGVAVRGAYPLDHFKKIVDRHLGKTPAAKADGEKKA
jgi:protein-disulfide isomerase